MRKARRSPKLCDTVSTLPYGDILHHFNINKCDMLQKMLAKSKYWKKYRCVCGSFEGLQQFYNNSVGVIGDFIFPGHFPAKNATLPN